MTFLLAGWAATIAPRAVKFSGVTVAGKLVHVPSPAMQAQVA